MHKLDVRGMSCPQPVLITKKAVESTISQLDILVDNKTALNNVTRYLKSQGFTNISSESDGEDIVIHATK